jgi:phosphatidylserine decarboxylase
MAALFVLFQRLLPKYLLTALVYRLARIRHVATKDFLIRQFVRWYDVDIEELAHPVPEGFPTFNDFFIRELAPGARDVDEAPGAIVSPVDGTVSAAGRIEDDRLFQAKGLDYSLTELLATDVADVSTYANGEFATIYLAPYNYHRVHAPVDGELHSARYVPGGLFSVNEATVSNLPGLFARNERLVCHATTPHGPMALIFVGALNVGTIHSRWTGDIRPRSGGVVDAIDLRQSAQSLSFARGDTLGWFNMGSTVILLFPEGVVDGFGELDPGQTVRMGEVLGHVRSPR